MVAIRTRGNHPVQRSGFDLTVTPFAPTTPNVSGGFSQDVLVSVIPPLKPAETRTSRSPCDIVLVIDVSGSMDTIAPAPVVDPNEKSDKFSVLDLVKHAMRTVLNSLGDQDRLGIVTFSTHAKVICELEPVTPDAKGRIETEIAKLVHEDLTNMWDGIKTGLSLFAADPSSSASSANSYANNVAAMLVLTDGLPNHMCPPQSYVNKIEQMYPVLPCSIYTFGFGYQLRSGLLKSIAEIGGGSYQFIPDSGMIGTVFVHAVANLQATAASRATLELAINDPRCVITCEMGVTVDVLESESTQDQSELSIPLGQLQYGQSRDMIIKIVRDASPSSAARLAIKYHGGSDWSEAGTWTPDTMSDGGYSEASAWSPETMNDSILHATLSYFSHEQGSDLGCRMASPLTRVPQRLTAEQSYHKNRALLTTFLSSLSPVNITSREHIALAYSPSLSHALTKLISEIESSARAYPSAETNSLLADLCGPDPHGQISLALFSAANYNKWGTHYLLSLLNAHQKQACNSFKDPGPLQYSTKSPVFQFCRNHLDRVFDQLPPLVPARMRREGRAHAFTTTSLSSYHRPENPCFAEKCRIAIAKPKDVADSRSIAFDAVRNGGYHTIPLTELRPSDAVITPRGPRQIAAILRTACTQKTEFVQLGDLLVTPWHPICYNGIWSFPAKITDGRTVLARDANVKAAYVYSLLLAPSVDPEAHSVLIEGVWGVTLGCGITRSESRDVRRHPFWSDYGLVASQIAKLGFSVSDGIVDCSGSLRDGGNGVVIGLSGDLLWDHDDVSRDGYMSCI